MLRSGVHFREVEGKQQTQVSLFVVTGEKVISYFTKAKPTKEGFPKASPSPHCSVAQLKVFTNSFCVGCLCTDCGGQ
jgi:hypothetical protein